MPKKHKLIFTKMIIVTTSPKKFIQDLNEICWKHSTRTKERDPEFDFVYECDQCS